LIPHDEHEKQDDVDHDHVDGAGANIDDTYLMAMHGNQVIAKLRESF